MGLVMKLPLKLAATLATLGFVACAPTPAPTPQTFRVEVSARVNSATPSFQIKQKLAAVVVTRSSDLSGWAERKFVLSQAPSDANGGSATPISRDGYFLTASHVIKKSFGQHIYIVYSGGGLVKICRARVIWDNPSADMALLHIPVETPHYYRWASFNQKQAPGKMLFNGGMRWKDDLNPRSSLSSNGSLIYGWVSDSKKTSEGRLSSSIAAEGDSSGSQKFDMDLPLMPGDSGGPVVDSSGRLVGVNSSVQVFDTGVNAYFISSTGVRPNLNKIESLIRADRS